MSFIAKLCSNVIQRGFTKVTAHAANQPVCNFHMMLRALPRISDAPSSIPVSNFGDSMLKTSIATGLQRMLVPVLPVLNQVAGFKVKGRLKRRCKDCYFVIRQQRHYVICPTHRRHKQMSMKKRDYKTWILTDATQSKIRPF